MKIIFSRRDIVNFKAMGLDNKDIERIRKYLPNEAHDFAMEIVRQKR